MPMTKLCELNSEHLWALYELAQTRLQLFSEEEVTEGKAQPVWNLMDDIERELAARLLTEQ